MCNSWCPNVAPICEGVGGYGNSRGNLGSLCVDGQSFRTINVRLSPGELYAAIKVLQYRIRNRIMRQRVLVVLIGILIASALAYLFQLITGSRFHSTLIVGEITFIAILLGSGISILIQVIGERRLLMKFASHPSSRFHSQHISVGDQGIAVVADAHMIYARWSALTEILVKRNLILFMRQSDAVAVIPFHVFPNEVECAAFRSYINNQMQASLQSRPSQPTPAREGQ